VAPVSALVTVTVSADAGGVIKASGGDVTDGMATELQAGMGTGEAVSVGLGGGTSIELGVCVHPAASIASAVPKRVDRSLQATHARYQGSLRCFGTQVCRGPTGEIPTPLLVSRRCGSARPWSCSRRF
jgi:hypothetical protein